MRWIKASDRLPPRPDDLNNHYRTPDGRKINGNFYESGGGCIKFGILSRSFPDYDIEQKDFDKIEWLDETADPAEVLVKDVTEAIEMIEGKKITFSKFQDLMHSALEQYKKETA